MKKWESHVKQVLKATRIEDIGQVFLMAFPTADMATTYDSGIPQRWPSPRKIIKDTKDFAPRMATTKDGRQILMPNPALIIYDDLGMPPSATKLFNEKKKVLQGEENALFATKMETLINGDFPETIPVPLLRDKLDGGKKDVYIISASNGLIMVGAAYYDFFRKKYKNPTFKINDRWSSENAYSGPVLVESDGERVGVFMCVGFFGQLSDNAKRLISMLEKGENSQAQKEELENSEHRHYTALALSSWKMTKQEYLGFRKRNVRFDDGEEETPEAWEKDHIQKIKIALKEKEPVPENVIKSYPSIAEDVKDQKWKEMISAALKWKGATAHKAKGLEENKKMAMAFMRITQKGDLDSYLMRKFGIDEASAREISNHLTAQDLKPDTNFRYLDYRGEAWIGVDKNIGRSWNSIWGKQTIVKWEPDTNYDQNGLYTVETENSNDGGVRMYSDRDIEKTIKEQEYDATPEGQKDREARLKKMQKDKEWEAEREAREAKAEAERREVKGFLDDANPMRTGKILKALNKLETLDGKVGPRKKLIENLVADGWTVEENRAFSYEETEKRINKYRKELDTLYRWRVSGDPDDPKTIRAKDLERRIRERDVIEGVPERKLKSPDGSGYYDQSVVTKVGLDYAEYLIGKKKEETPEKPPK